VLLAGCGRFGFDAVRPTDVGDAGHTDATTLDTSVTDAPFDAAAIAGLVVRYPMDDNLTNGVATSTDATLDGMCTACPTATTGRFGGGYTFSNDRIQLPTSSLVGEAPHTVSVWMRPQTITDGAAINKAYSNTSDYAPYSLGFYLSALEYESTANGSSADGLFDPLARDLTGAWHHVATTWDGATKCLYLDGTRIAMANATILDSTRPITIGADTDGGVPTRFYTGDLDELRFYNRALDTGEILALTSNAL